MEPFDFSKWHLELTSKCALACPRCPRTLFRGTYQVTDLKFELIKKVFDNLQVSSVALCGNFGDPIFHGEFHEVIAYFKSKGASVMLTTSGSGRPRQWWEKTAELLGEGDQISFSVDGLEDTNPIYRVNSRWSDIMTAMETVNLNSSIYTVWKFIVFRHNQHQIDDAKKLAEQKGVNAFQLVRSNRFRQWLGADEKDLLEPSNEYVSDFFRQWRESPKEEEMVLRAKCRGGVTQHYISATGHYSLCCWGGYSNPSRESPFQANKESFDLNTYSLSQIVSSDVFEEIVASMADYRSAMPLCKMYCGQKKAEKDTSYLWTTDSIRTYFSGS